MKGLKPLVLILCMAGGLVALVFAVQGFFARTAAEHWRRQLTSAGDDHVPTVLAQVAALDEAGVPVLVEALGSGRESVASTAKELLELQLGRWERLSSRARSARMGTLAEALADQVDQFGPTAREDAADLVTRILNWPLEPNAVDRAEVLSDCNEVLEVTMARRPAPARQLKPPRPPGSAMPDRDPLEAATNRFATRSLATDSAMASGPSIARLARMPGGGLPVQSHNVEPLPTGLPPEPRIARTPSARPQVLLPPSANPLNPLRESGQSAPVPPALLPPGPQGVRSLPGPQLRAADGRSTVAEPIRSLSAEQPQGPSSTGPLRQPSGMAGVNTFDLMRSFQSGDRVLAGQAEAELRRRGFGDVHLQLARRLFDPNPDVRRQLAQVLPGIQSVDPAPWLKWLAGDGDRQVRKTALTVMATTRDPALLAEVDRAARDDPDPGIRALAQRFLDQQRAARQEARYR